MIRTVGELIEALRGLNPSLPVAVKSSAYLDSYDSGRTTIKRKEAQGIPLMVEVEDVYYPDATLKGGTDAVVCISNGDPADMKVE